MKTFKTTNGKDVIVSDGDYQRVIEFKWYAKPTGYIYASIRKKAVYLHRFLLNAKTGEIVDHKDRKPLNNDRDNLRIVSVSNNRQNSKKKLSKQGKALSQYKGVTRTTKKKHKSWQVYICKDKKPMYVGVFKTELAAARAYDRWAIKLFGEYACTNKMLYGI